MVSLRSKSAPRKSKRLQESTKIQKKIVEKAEKGLQIKKKVTAKRSRKQNFDNYCEEVKKEPITPPSSRRGSRCNSPIIIPHFGPVILNYVNARKSKRKPSFKPKNNDWIKKGSKIEFVGPEKRLFRANVQRRGHKKQREYILVDYLYKNSYKTKLPPKNLWLEEPDYDFFQMQNVKANNNNEENTTTKASINPKKSTKKTVEQAKVRSKSSSRAEKQPKQPKKTLSNTSKKTASTSQPPKTPSKQRLPSTSRPRTQKTPRVQARRDSSPEIISQLAFPSPPSEPRSPTRPSRVAPPYHVPENPVYNLTSTPVNSLPKPKPFRPWPMSARKPILAGSASPRSIHSGTSSIDLFLRNRRASGPYQQDLADINEEEDFDNEVLMLSPRRDRIRSQPVPRATPRVGLNDYHRRLSFNSQPSGRVLSMPPPASSGSPSPSINSSNGSTSGPRRRPSKRWDDIFATRSPRKLQHSFSQPATSTSRSLHGDFMSQTANSQPLETSTVIHRPGHRNFSESQPSLNTSRRSLNDISIEDEDDMNDEAETLQIKRRSRSKKSKNVKSNSAIWDEAISQIKI